MARPALKTSYARFLVSSPDRYTKRWNSGTNEFETAEEEPRGRIPMMLSSESFPHADLKRQRSPSTDVNRPRSAGHGMTDNTRPKEDSRGSRFGNTTFPRKENRNNTGEMQPTTSKNSMTTVHFTISRDTTSSNGARQASQLAEFGQRLSHYTTSFYQSHDGRKRKRSEYGTQSALASSSSTSDYYDKPGADGQDRHDISSRSLRMPEKHLPDVTLGELHPGGRRRYASERDLERVLQASMREDEERKAREFNSQLDNEPRRVKRRTMQSKGVNEDKESGDESSTGNLWTEQTVPLRPQPSHWPHRYH